ncbi:MAG: hypothetical protein ACYC2H_12050 [Thermoplasmatota archaeon]
MDRGLVNPATRRAVKLGLLLGLAHHPLCTEFQSDVVQLGRIHACSGCLATWPVFLVAVPLIAAARLQGMPALPLLAAGLAMGVPQLASYGWRRSRAERAAAKALGGLGLACVAIGVLAAGWPPAVLLAVLAAGLVTSIGLQVIRMRTILATCGACPFKRAWDVCPGFNAGVAATRRDGDGGPDIPASLLPP